MKKETVEFGINNLKKILVPVDFSRYSELTLKFAISLSRLTGARITALHVFEKPVIPEAIWMSKQIVDIYKNYHKEAEKKAKEELKKFIQQFDTRGINLKTRVVSGIPFIEIIKRSRKEKIDLIILGSKGLTVFQKVLIGSTADRVVRKAKCSVLVIKK